MNKTKLKNYAPKARREFIQAVKDRAAGYGLTKKKTEEAKISGDFVIIAGKPFPKAVADQREALEERIQRSSFDQVMEEIAYTWFNRFVAIRYMEVHGYLSHGYRVLSHPDADSPVPEILEKAVHVDLQGLDKDKVVQLKMDGTKDEELYRMLLIAQCNELYRWMPFLFENIRDCTELLLPDNLLHSDSLVRKLVDEIDEADWQEVEIIGWLYQFYISEKKDAVIGKVVKSEDIPAATQLFTPNWIVKYLVQNSLGAQWMRTYPNSPLKEKMEYYIKPAEQTEEVQRQLAEITPESLNPEELTLLDPACGSGHILVEGYDLLKEIYLERGYRGRDIPELILRKNLFGLEIDDRAAQLAGFAVIMKARADDRRIFERGVVPNVVSIQESKGIKVEDILIAINEPLTSKDVTASPKSMEELQDSIEVPLFASKPTERIALDPEEKLTVDDLKTLLALFEHGKTFGSLIRIPKELAMRLPAMARRLERSHQSGQSYAQAQAERVKPFIKQALLLARCYDAVVANPPYMNNGYLDPLLKEFAKSFYTDSKTDLCTMFMDAGIALCRKSGILAIINLPSWMFLVSFERLRDRLLREHTIASLLHLGRGVFGSDFGTVAFAVFKNKLDQYRAVYRRLFIEHVKVDHERTKTHRFFNRTFGYYEAIQDSFVSIPKSPIAYWLSDTFKNAFQKETLKAVLASEGAVKTGNNEKYLRYLWEVSCSTVSPDSNWRKHPKGGDYRKWYGNLEWAVDWSETARKHYRTDHIARIPVESIWNISGITWTSTSSAKPSFRLLREDEIANNSALFVFPLNPTDLTGLLCYLNSSVVLHFLAVLNPTVQFLVGDIMNIPKPEISFSDDKLTSLGEHLLRLAQADWDSFEISWDFKQSPVTGNHLPSLAESYSKYKQDCHQLLSQMKEREEENNRYFIKMYHLQDEMAPDVNEKDLTLRVNPKYRYGDQLTEVELEKRFREDTVRELLSYAVGCMMGRYSLDEPGLIFAQNGNGGFEPNRYKKFPADDDGIIPITDRYWFDDDAAERFFTFVGTVWAKDTLEENLDFVAESIGRKTNETSRDAIRRFFVNEFFKDHLKRYKKRPIYWLFSSGKEKALQCLVYLHRYNEGTLSRMRTEYLIPLQGRISSKIESLEKDIDHAPSTSAANKIRKEIATLEKQAEELRKYDEKLRHYADMKISLDLDDGVKVNYGKFGDLLAEVKAVTGSTD